MEMCQLAVAKVGGEDSNLIEILIQIPIYLYAHYIMIPQYRHFFSAYPD